MNKDLGWRGVAAVGGGGDGLLWDGARGSPLT